MKWWSVSMIGAVVGVPLGYGIAWALSHAMLLLEGVLGVVGFVIALVGFGIGAVLVGVVGGAAAGAMIGFVQRSAWKEESPYEEQWAKLGTLGWALVGIFTSAVLVPIVYGDLSPLVWLVALGALLSGAAQWLGLQGRIQQARQRILIGGLGALSGGLVGVTLLGAIIGNRGAFDPLRRAVTLREFVYEVSATGLTNLNDTLVFFVASGKSPYDHWWELWTSDGTAGGTVPVKRFEAGWNPSFITLQTQVNDVLFFTATGANRSEGAWLRDKLRQWRTDGTSAGTIPLDFFSYHLTTMAMGGNLYFHDSLG
jgi:ELWxxDGT repeat protein